MTPRRIKPSDHIVADSAAMRRVVARVEALADGDQPVLIVGEPGVGREYVARVLHAAGPRWHRSPVSVRGELVPTALVPDPARCASMRTLRAARGSTLLVRALCDVPSEAQRRLAEVAGVAPPSPDTPPLRAADRDIRVVALADVDVDRAASAGLLHRDLFAALSAQRLDIPPLRERAADIPALCERFVRDYARELGRGRVSVSVRAHERLAAYPWPGNVAELRAIARRLALRVGERRIDAADVDAVLPMVAERVPLEEISFEDMVRSQIAELLRRVDGYPMQGLHEQVVSRVESSLFELVLAHTGGNQVRAAEILGLNRNTLRRKLNAGKRAAQSRDGAARGRDGATRPAGAPARTRRADTRDSDERDSGERNAPRRRKSRRAG